MSSDAPETRERILKTTVSLLESSRGRGVRLSDIAKQAGITRQALYLHFRTRADLLIAATLYIDDVKGANQRLAASRAATKGADRLNAYVRAWANYIPEIYGVGLALIAMSDTDEAAATAWARRMQDMREGCEAAIDALVHDNQLVADLSPKQATDMLWTLLSVHNWEQLTIECGWSQAQYAESLQNSVRRLFVTSRA